jgi:PAS domain S-box-containing protein
MGTVQLPQVKWASGQKVGTRFGLALALLITIGGVSYLTTLRLRETDLWESRVEDALDKLNTTALQLEDVEAGQRGYLITGDEHYLVRYQTAMQTIEPAIKDLRELTSNDPSYRQKIDRLVSSIATRFAEVTQINELRKKQGFESAARVILTHNGKPIFDDTLQLIGELKDEQDALLQQQTDDAEARALTINLSITFGGFLAIMLAAFMISRDIIERKRADEALRESTARFRRLAENALDMIYRYRLLPTRGFEYVSPAATLITGYAPDDFYADPDLGYKLLRLEDQWLFDALKHPSDSTVPVTVRWIHKDGSVIWTSQQLVPIYDLEGNLMAIEGIVRDVTERIQAYQMLEQRVEERTHEIERRRQVAEGLRDIMTILNSNRPLDAILDSIVAQACRLLGTDAGAVYHLHEQKGLLCTQVAQGFDANDAALNIPVAWGAFGEAMLSRQIVAASNASAALDEDSDLILEPQQRDGLASLFCRYRALLVVPLMIKDDIYGAIALYYQKPHEFTREETELAVAFGDQAALAIENARLRTQAERMAAAAERNRLARDLHDAVTQTLFSTSLIADVLPRLWERDQNAARRRLDELRQLTRAALAEMRALLLELRPATVTEVGVGELLRQLTEAVTSQARVPIALTIDGQCRLPPDVQIAVYRITQEALNNVARHANASQATVHLYCRADKIELQISDNGQGFDPISVALEHLGLGIMRERAEGIGAALRVESQPGSGTQVTIMWPRETTAQGGLRERAKILPSSFAFRGGGSDE